MDQSNRTSPPIAAADSPALSPSGAAAFQLLDVPAAAAWLGLPIWRVYELVERGAVPCRRVGRRVYFTRADLAAALDLLAVPARQGTPCAARP